MDRGGWTRSRVEGGGDGGGGRGSEKTAEGIQQNCNKFSEGPCFSCFSPTPQEAPACLFSPGLPQGGGFRVPPLPCFLHSWAHLPSPSLQTAAETAELDLNPVPPPAVPQPAPAPAPAPPSPAPTPPAPSPVLESPPAAPQPAPSAGNLCSPPPAQPSFTKIIIPKQMLPSSLAVSSQGGVVTVIPVTSVTSRGLQLGTGATQIVTRSVLQAAAAAAAAASSMQLPRLQPPPLQQMPPPQPPAQQVAVLQPPPPLQAMQQPALQQKVRLHLQQQPPPLQIKILPPPALQIQPVTLQPEEASPERPSPEPQGSPEPVEMITADVVPEVRERGPCS